MRQLAKFYLVWFRNYEEKEESNANRNLESLEMAHIRLEAALETSERWQITDASLLRWRRKLKRAAQECDETMHKCKQRILDDEQMQQEEPFCRQGTAP